MNRSNLRREEFKDRFLKRIDRVKASCGERVLKGAKWNERVVGERMEVVVQRGI